MITTDDSNRVMMSDELKDIINTEEPKPNFVLVTINCASPIVGSLIGIELHGEKIKFDIRVDISDGFDTLTKFRENKQQLSTKSIILSNDSFEQTLTKNLIIDASGALSSTVRSSYNVELVKLFDIDHSLGMCTLAFDFI